MSKIEETLKERESAHGDWKLGCTISQKLKIVLSYNVQSRPDYINEALDRICMKLSRIVVGNCEELDHWHDIAGYATLTEEAIRETTDL